MSDERPGRRRRMEAEVTITAGVDDVWAALTRAEELVRWFPLDAEVVPGVGGSVLWSWAGAWTWKCDIERWEPPHHLLLGYTAESGFDVSGQPLPPDGAPERLAVEIELRSEAGKTRVRLVHSGFGFGERWDDELDGVTSGWKSELRGLAFYLERHRGKDRRPMWVQTASDRSEAEVWSRLLADGAFPVRGGALAAGDAFTLADPTGRSLSGTVLTHLPQRDLTLRVRELDDALLRFGTHRAAGKTGVMVWLSTWGDAVSATDLAAFERATRERLDLALGVGG